MEQEYEEIDIKELIFILMKKWWLILLTTFMGMCIAGVMSFIILEPVYSGYTTLFVGNAGGTNSSEPDLSTEALNVNAKLIGDYMELAKSKLVASETIDELNLDVTPSQFINVLKVSAIKDTRMFRLTFEGTKPEEIAQILNTFTGLLKDRAKEIISVDNIKVIDKADVPQVPIRPRRALNLAIGVMLGGMIGVLIVLGQHFLDNTIKSPTDVERLLELPVLGSIPIFDGEVKR